MEKKQIKMQSNIFWACKLFLKEIILGSAKNNKTKQNKYQDNTLLPN